VQERIGVREVIEPWARKVVRSYLPEGHRAFFAALPFVVVAARDEAGRPWVTIVAGAPGFVTSPDPNRLRITSGPVDGDALHGALASGADIGLLGIELGTRRRNRVNGRVRSHDPDGICFEVDQSFGNCPQYIVERAWRPSPLVPAAPPPVRIGHLTPELMNRVRGADTLFIGTGHRGSGGDPAFGMDASHRGGAPGFVDVVDARTVVIPDYSGNNHFNTVGNLVLDSRAGLLFVDFETGGMLQLTGRTEIDWDSEDVARYPGARRLIRFALEEAICLEHALPLRWDVSARSVYSLRLIEKTPESDDVISFVFEATNGGALPDFEAGQHLPIELELPNQREQAVRTYSLSSAPGKGRYRISVKREPQGVASRHMHDALEVGATVTARAPAGDFILDHGPRPVVLVSAGIGVTPMVSMLHALVERGEERLAWFVHGARDGKHHPLAREVAALAAKSEQVTAHVSYSRPLPDDRRDRSFDAEGRVDGALLQSLHPDLDAEFYLCGPIGFMAELRTTLEQRGVPGERIHTESFGSIG
jgi:ferredoxin-NADP reductase/predicted pyridoxine 5'-phosphate oxidase superfamily flavin-nucleotide-binding protein